jgi:hypothetical protein
MQRKNGLLLTSLSLFTLAYSSGAIASQPDPTALEDKTIHTHHKKHHHKKKPVYIDPAHSQWNLGVTALYAQPAYSQPATYETIDSTSISGTTTTNDNRNYSISPQYDWGYEALLGYRFKGSDRDLTLTYMHFANTETDSVNTVPAGATTSPFFVNTAEGELYSQLDMADLVAGQRFHFAQALTTRFVAGVAYARIQQDLTGEYDEGTLTSVASGVPANSTSSNTSTFNGVGPKLGANADYEISHSGFGLVGGVSAALLFGSLDHSNTVTQNFIGGGVTTTTTTKNRIDPTSTSVTNLNANLGTRYDIAFRKQALHLELGYRINQFIDAVYTDNDMTLSGFYLNATGSFW